MAVPRVSDLALLSDCRSAALVDRAGAVVWWCPDRFDASSWFGSLLGTKGGAWSLTPRETREVGPAYLEDSLILRTTFVTTSGVVELTEGLLFAGLVRAASALDEAEERQLDARPIRA